MSSSNRAAKAKVSFSYQDDRFVKYSIGTEDGENPDAVNKPDWKKRQFAIHQTGALGENGSFLIGFAREEASANKQKEGQYIDRDVESHSKSDF